MIATAIIEPRATNQRESSHQERSASSPLFFRQPYQKWAIPTSSRFHLPLIHPLNIESGSYRDVGLLNLRLVGYTLHSLYWALGAVSNAPYVRQALTINLDSLTLVILDHYPKDPCRPQRIRPSSNVSTSRPIPVKCKLQFLPLSPALMSRGPYVYPR